MNRKQRRTQAKDMLRAPYRPSAHAQALFEAAMQGYRQGQLTEAEQLCRQILVTEPRHADALHLLAVMANRAGRQELAGELAGRAIASDAGFAPYHLTLGGAMLGLGRSGEAEKAFRAAARVDPGRAEAQAGLGSALLAQGRMEEAAPAFMAAIRLRPGVAKTYSDLGMTLYGLGRLEDALKAYEEAVRLDPDDAPALTNLGNALNKLGRPAAAITALDRAVAARPEMAEIHLNRGNALEQLRRPDEAVRSFDRAIVLKPDLVEAHLFRAMAMLALGDFVGGLEGYEWRKRMSGPSAARSLPQPEWTGRESLQGKTLFIHAEQGLGDTLQFCRYAPLAAARGARVILSVQDSLLPLLTGFDPAVEVIGAGLTPDRLDFQCALLSLPRAFGATPQNIPAPIAYVRAPPGEAVAWRGRLGEASRLRIGLVWSGNAAHPNDRNRSIPLRALAPLLSFDAEWISLQNEVRESDRPALVKLGDFATELTDFAQTAALVDNLDMVVAVDTSVAHLAAAMGKPTLLLLPYAGDWRWGLQGEISSWYPTARLFRQPAPGDWAGAMAEVRAALERFASRAISAAP